MWQVLHDVGQALRHVHASGLVHLDVKPANLLIGDEGDRLAQYRMMLRYRYFSRRQTCGCCSAPPPSLIGVWHIIHFALFWTSTSFDVSAAAAATG